MAVFREGHSVLISRTQIDGNSDGLAGLLNKKIGKELASCPYVADEAVQKALRTR